MEQKLKGFLAGEAKIGENKAIKFNFMQYVFFEKGIRCVYNEVTFNCKLLKKLFEQAVLVAPSSPYNFVWGATAPQ